MIILLSWPPLFSSTLPRIIRRSANNDAPYDRKINTSPSTVEEKDILKKMLTTPPIKKIDLHFPLGMEVVARNLRGVTIKDALDAIHKAYKKRVSLASMPLVYC